MLPNHFYICQIIVPPKINEETSLNEPGDDNPVTIPATNLRHVCLVESFDPTTNKAWVKFCTFNPLHAKGYVVIGDNDVGVLENQPLSITPTPSNAFSNHPKEKVNYLKFAQRIELTVVDHKSGKTVASSIKLDTDAMAQVKRLEQAYWAKDYYWMRLTNQKLKKMITKMRWVKRWAKTGTEKLICLMRNLTVKTQHWLVGKLISFPCLIGVSYLMRIWMVV